MRKGLISGISAAVALLAATFPLRAANIVITEPDNSYTSQTSLIDISGLAEESFVGSIQDANLQVLFGGSVQKLAVGVSWGVWNDPPATEDSLPPVLYTNGAASLTMTLSADVNVFGFELEPDLGEIEPVTVTFFGSGSPFALTLNPNGNSGALLFAVSSDTPINMVTIEDGAGDDFAIANVRYAQIPLVVPTPEPSMLLPVAAVLGLAIVRRRGITPHRKPGELKPAMPRADKQSKEILRRQQGCKQTGRGTGPGPDPGGSSARSQVVGFLGYLVAPAFPD